MDGNANEEKSFIQRIVEQTLLERLSYEIIFSILMFDRQAQA